MQKANKMTLDMYRRMRGVTMLELMIVVVIVGILTAIAYPNYREFAARAKRVEAKSILLEIATSQERFYLNNNRYGSMTELGYDDPQLTDSGSYSVTINGNDANNYTALATYQFGGAEGDKCGSFTIDGRGDKISSGSIGNCWTQDR